MRILLFFLLSLSACQNRTDPALRIAKVNLRIDPCTLDPSIARSVNDLTLAKMFFEGLTRVGANEEPELALAESVEVSSDLMTYTFRLRSSQWSNGDPVKASDFIYAWKRNLSPLSASYALQLYCIKNAKAIKEGIIDSEELGVSAIGEDTLIVELETPVPYFLKIVALPVYFPICEKVDRQHRKWTQEMEQFVCNGPFYPIRWAHSDSLSVRKNPMYWDAKQVKLDGLELIMVNEETELGLFEKGMLHWVGSPLSNLPVDALEMLKKKDLLQVKPVLGTAFIRTNLQRKPFCHLLVRRAFALAIQRQEIVNHVLQGGQAPATGLVPTTFALQKQPYFSDAAIIEAQRSFEQALKELAVTKETFPKITLTYASSERNHQLAQTLQAQWLSGLGISVALERLELKVYFDRLVRGDFDLILGSWFADLDDPTDFLVLFSDKSHARNNTGWEDRDYTELLHSSFQCAEKQKRKQLLSLCEKMLMDAMPIIPLFHYTMLYAQDFHLKGVILSYLGSLDFKWAELDTKN